MRTRIAVLDGKVPKDTMTNVINFFEEQIELHRSALSEPNELKNKWGPS